jgi:hypothetical protein
VLLRKNELGWRLYKVTFGFVIRRNHPPLRSRVLQFSPALISILLVAASWLLGHDPLSIKAGLYTIPGFLAFGLWCGRPFVLYANVRQRAASDSVVGHPALFAGLSIERGQDPESGRYQIHLENLQPSGETATRGGIWKCLAWESNTEAEASALAEEFRSWGIGTPDPIVLAVRGDKRLRWLAYGGHLLSLVALIAFLGWMTRGLRQANKEPDAEVVLLVLRAAQIFIAFLFLSLLPLATYLWRLGRGAIRCRQMPPPGMKIIWDTKLIEGDKAITQGRRMAAVGFVLIAIGLVGGLYVPYKLGSLYGEPLRSATHDVSNHR